MIESFVVGACIILGSIIVGFVSHRRKERIRSLTLHQKLMASTLKNPSHGPIYF
jgi:hypothetical protein